MSGIFNAAIFNNTIFNTGVAGAVVAEPEVVKTGTGGADPGDGAGPKRKRIVKPTGLPLRLPRKEGRKEVGDRVDESQAIQAEIAARLAREFGEDSAALAERERIELSAAQVSAEIGRLLHKKMRTEEDEVMLLLLMAAAAV